MSRYELSRRLNELEADRSWWLTQKLSAVTVADQRRAAMMLQEIELQIRDLKREVNA
jgi:hypothetical protein